ncbi:LysR family transcriptional regulator [Alloyangia pacifica]|uniref:DNA-binding transcriptional regulator, LysR family n=1 Tax=Alloyangia pacifica TaxID=311180 RepID=A0A1I6P1H2_9RHOB|nr:LysR family transcriptional regulator [Alloyangia pacifica]SDH54321.1 DNA-binding transcriptional regulator, LysR family [Alloyangia pacifica]SFS33938.1 DNA-binding transcriptional regulator, LysR family [Alloyangia pacifica]
MNNWDDLRFLVALSKTGTMTAAAKLLGTNTATVSRRIERLSETLGVPAFVKTADGWRPSEAVRELINVAQNFDGQLKSTLNNHGVGLDVDTVTLSLGASPIIASLVLFPSLGAQAELLPGVQLTVTERRQREGLGENDLVVQFGRPDQGRIVARKAGKMRFRPYRFVNSQPDGEWAGLNVTPSRSRILRQAYDAFGKDPKIRVDNFIALHALMQSTQMAGPLPDLLARKTPGLEPLHPDIAPETLECWLFYHESRRSDSGMRRAVDWIIQCFERFEAQPEQGGEDF